ncbi:GNAT family N-acetyltransferase [Lacinutrix chionoecetis]
MDKIQLNINNLTSLWTLAGKAFYNYNEKEAFCYAHVKQTQWPNRIWKNAPLSQAHLNIIMLKMKQEKGTTFSILNANDTEKKLISNHNFKQNSKQYGMSLVLRDSFETHREIDFIKVKSQQDAETWSQAFYQAFQYSISAETVYKTKDAADYFIIYHNQQLVGTIVYYVTDHVLGIHSLGVIPSMRKKGFGREIMHQALNQAIDNPILDLVTLQASEKAKTMYETLGFSHDFLLTNYLLN